MSDLNQTTAVVHKALPTNQRLAGYLRKCKVGSKGPIAFRRRYFSLQDGDSSACDSHDPNRSGACCRLQYYRGSDDRLPLGEIDISRASFAISFTKVQGSDFTGVPLDDSSPWVFEIRSQGNIYLLEAKDRQTLRYWLQELQASRRNYSRQRLNLIRCRNNNDVLGGEMLNTIEKPEEDGRKEQGEISLKNLKIELKNLISRRLNRNNVNRQSATEHAAEVTEKSSLTTSPRASIKLAPPTSIAVASSSDTLAPPTELKTSVSQPTSPTSNSKFYLPTPCMQCIQLREEVNKSLAEVQFFKENFRAAKELLQNQQVKCDELHRKLETATSTVDSRGAYERVCDKDQHISHLELRILDLDEQLELYQTDLDNERREKCSLREEIDMLRQSLTSKDEVVASYMMKQCAQGIQSSDQANQTLSVEMEHELQRKDDICNAYKEQNSFLNQEILELTYIREDDRHTEESLRSNWRESQKKYYNAQSHLIKALNQYRELKSTSHNSVTSVSTATNAENSTIADMLNEAMQEPTFPLSPISVSSLVESTGPVSYDSLGFLKNEIFTDSAEEKAKLYDLECQKMKYKDDHGEIDTSNHVKWENHFSQLSSRVPIYSNQVKSLVRSCGVPDKYREVMWLACIHHHLNDNPDYQNPDYYESLLKQKSSDYNASHKQIELDLLRTLPNNKFYQNINSDKVNKLRRILIAYSARNPYVGYCQGLNRLAALALLLLDETNAFWCLTLIVEHLMPVGYYSLTLSAAHADQKVLMSLFADKLPNLHQHFLSLQIDITSFTFNWFLTVFVDNVSPEIYLRIWDSFLFEGSKVLFRIALAFFKYNEDDLIKIKDQINCLNYLRMLPINIIDIDLLFKIAFMDLNPFPMKTISTRRITALEEIRIQLEHIAELRSKIKVRTELNSDSDSE